MTLTKEQVHQICKETTHDVWNESIPYGIAKTNGVIEGLKILLEAGIAEPGAGHDVFWGAPWSDTLTEDQVRGLARLGWFFSEEYDAWTIFV